MLWQDSYKGVDRVLTSDVSILCKIIIVNMILILQHLFYTLSGCHHLWQRAWIQDKLYPDHVVETLAKQYAHQVW